MKWFIASDIHGSAYWCSRMLEAFQKENADRLLLLGDILYHGPRNDLPLEYNPKEVASQLNKFRSRIFCVRGNCDSEVDQMMLEFPILSDYVLISSGSHCIFATHGHRFNSQFLPPISPGDVLLHGHTHVAELQNCDTYLYANPGSVSIPKDNGKNSYMVLKENCFIIKDLSGQELSFYNLL